MKLDVYAERAHGRTHVGAIETVQAAGERFTYDSSWLEGQGGVAPAAALSLSLPPTPEPYTSRKMRPYFDGLLPEGAARESLAKSAHVSTRSYVKLLAALGDECIGAVSFSAPDDEPAETYVPLSEKELSGLAKRSYRSTTVMNKRSRMSLAGSQAKVGLFRAGDGTWYEPRGGAPSTHILKPMNPRFEDVQLNEAICQVAARKCGIPVPEVEIIPTEVPLFCTKRFDRAFSEDGRVVDGLRRPARLHQEDFCQALGIAPERKYEDGNRHYLAQVAQLVRSYSAQPIEDLGNLWSLVAFNYLIGNCDAHLKNIAFVRDSTWTQMKLAPFYDLVCTTCYDELAGSFAMSIGGKRKLALIDRSAFEREAESLHLATRESERILCSLADSVPDAVREAARALAESGQATTTSMGDRIAAGAEKRARMLKSGN